jgi:hypothetical protein
MRHTRQNDIWPLCVNEPDELKAGVTNPPALQAVNLYPSWNRLHSITLVGDQTEVNLKVLWIEVERQMCDYSFGASAAQVRND